MKVYRVVRDALITAVALGVLVHEALSPEPRPELLLLVGSLLAVPTFLRVDEHLRRKNEKADE